MRETSWQNVCYLSAHRIQRTETTAITIAPEAMNTASDCQKLKLLPKNARYNTMKASQPKNATTVPAILAPKWFIVAILIAALKRFLQTARIHKSQNYANLRVTGETRMGYCQKCGHEVTEGNNFCPNCGANLKTVQSEGSSGEKDCPRCGTVMRVGFIVEKDSPLSLWTLGSGIYWTPGEAGVMGERVGVKAYACPQCGYIEHYVRYLDRDKKTILSAPTTFTE
jgi:ribosomal protein S27AE